MTWITLEEEGLCSVLIEDGDWIVHLDVECHQNSLKFLLVFSVYNRFPLVIQDLVGAGRVGDGASDPDGVSVQLRLVGALAHIDQSHLHGGAGLVGADEGLVAVAASGYTGLTAQGEHNCREDGRLTGPIFSREEGQSLIRNKCKRLEINNMKYIALEFGANFGHKYCFKFTPLESCLSYIMKYIALEFGGQFWP